jgi:hypothetical protein
LKQRSEKARVSSHCLPSLKTRRHFPSAPISSRNQEAAVLRASRQAKSATKLPHQDQLVPNCAHHILVFLSHNLCHRLFIRRSARRAAIDDIRTQHTSRLRHTSCLTAINTKTTRTGRPPNRATAMVVR